MEEAMASDFEFLENLYTRYNSIDLVTSQTYGRKKTDVTSEELQEVRELMKRILVELQEIKEKQEPLFSTTAEDATFDIKGAIDDYCKHWKGLLKTHIKVIRVLELQQAQEGSEFHFSKEIELEERRKRVSKLRKTIGQNC